MTYTRRAWWDISLCFGKTFGRGLEIDFDILSIGLGMGVAFSTGTFYFNVPFLLISGRWK